MKKSTIWLVVVLVIILAGGLGYMIWKNQASADVAAGVSTPMPKYTGGTSYAKTVIVGTVTQSTISGQALGFQVRVDQGFSSGKTISVFAIPASTTYSNASQVNIGGGASYGNFSDYYNGILEGKKIGIPVGSQLAISGTRILQNSTGVVTFIADAVTAVTQLRSSATSTPTPVKTSASSPTIPPPIPTPTPVKTSTPQIGIPEKTPSPVSTKTSQISI